MTFASSPGDMDPAQAWGELSDVWIAAAEKVGFATPKHGMAQQSPADRVRRVELRTRAAGELVSEVQQYLLDDDPMVQRAARAGVKKVVHRSLTGEYGDRAWGTPSRPSLVDRLLARRFAVVDPDRPEPRRSEPKVQRKVRARLIGSALFTALASGVFIAIHQPLVALPLLILAGVLDIVEGSWARVVGMRDSAMRWLSCVASHVADMSLIAAIVIVVVRDDRPTVALVLAAAMLLSLAGSFVRVSALQAGYHLWRAHWERLLRYAAIGVYCVLAALGLEVLAVVVVIFALAAGGIFEVVRVIVAVIRMPAIHGAGVMVLDSDDELQLWGLGDDGGLPAWGARSIDMTSDPRLKATF